MIESTKALKSKTKKVYKDNKLNHACFATYNLNDYRVYLTAISLIGGVTTQGKYMQPDELPRDYRLSAMDFAKQFGIAPNNAYKILKKAMDKLRKADIKIERPDIKQTWYINVCEVVKYNEHEGTIDIMFTGSIMEYLRQRTKSFTLYNLNEVSNLTSFYAVRLYELVQQFNTTTGFLIHTVEQWRELFGLNPEQYPMYSNLKIKVLNQALEEINSKTGYNLKMTEEKDGRKVARVRFDFIPDQVHAGIDAHTGERRTRHKKPRTQLISQKQTKKSTSKIPVVHPNQQELPLNDVLSHEQPIHQPTTHQQEMQPATQLESTTSEIEVPPQKEQQLPIDIQQPILSNPPLQKKKRFFGLF
jgi:plasmid replication initiation protein